VNQESYAAMMKAYAPKENARMRANLMGEYRGAGGHPDRLPLKLLTAAKALHRKGFLTPGDLGRMMDTSTQNARALLDRLEKAGLATSEIHHDARVRIYAFHVPEA